MTLRLMASDSAPKMIGVFGVPGSGKTHLLHALRDRLSEDKFKFFEGSEVLGSCVAGGLDAFKSLSVEQRALCRRQTIENIAAQCRQSGRTAILTGHHMFWEENKAPEIVWSGAEEERLTHIVYLDVEAATVAQQHHGDRTRRRTEDSVEHIRQHQNEEKRHLQEKCRDHGILFVRKQQTMTLDRLVAILDDFEAHDESSNLAKVENRLDVTVGQHGTVDTAVVLDADRTLAVQDASAIFWQNLRALGPCSGPNNPLKPLFNHMGYSYKAFRQAMLLCEEAVTDDEFAVICSEMADEICLYPAVESMLHGLLRKPKSTMIVVVTCGLGRVWDQVLQEVGFSAKVCVIGGGRISDGLVVTPDIKACIVSRLRNKYHAHTWAVGDSPVDVPMMLAADQAIVVVGEVQRRSRSMDKALSDAISYHGLQAYQVLIPETVEPRLDRDRMPVVRFTDQNFVRKMSERPGLKVTHMTDSVSAQILMSPTRDATVHGPGLQHAHRNIGRYLAVHFVAPRIGIEPYNITHVQGHPDHGARLRDEDRTTIVALMRGGLPMAQGIFDAFPRASFVHVNDSTSLQAQHLEGQACVILVDSVIDSGKSMAGLIRRVREIQPSLRIIVVAGVVQRESIQAKGPLESIEGRGNLEVFALRLLSNKFVGTKATDTGNRFFNTTTLS